MKLNQIFDQLWNDYTSQNPSVQRIYDLFVGEGENVENDHIAFRTFDDPRINIDVLARPFIEAGYVYKGDYHFEEKHLYAKHFECEGAPRVFISELKTKDFSSFLQNKVTEIVDRIPVEILKSDSLIYGGSVWETVSYDDYEKLREESEYAAWLMVNGFRANHFTVSINSLKKYDTVEKVNHFVQQHGFRINDSGGAIKGTPAELLEQSSTRSEMIEMKFMEGLKEIPGCYYEFARRYADKDGRLYSGFIAKSADKIFESTDIVK
ncbi:MAG: DUF1338 domain-containing protein [Bacteroidales bacterium]|nr:DUF1338 domain-containing protein [Bacteroidales bacterium]